MTLLAERIIDLIIDRRSVLISQAEGIIAGWFNSPSAARPRRLYVPLVRAVATPAGTISPRIYWCRRWPVVGFSGKPMRTGRGGPVRHTRVRLQYIAARRSGESYPLAAFRDASQEELSDIEGVEKQLRPIRHELKALGHLLQAARVYQKRCLADTTLSEEVPACGHAF